MIAPAAYDFAALYRDLPRLTEVNRMTCPGAFLWYIANGYNVRPERPVPGGRVLVMPRGGWGYDTIPVMTMAEAEWLAANWQPDWTIGMVMSESSGLFTIDVDNRAAWQAWQEQHGEVRSAAEQVTPRGDHLVFRRPEDGRLPRNLGGTEVKVKGHITVAPSVRQDGGRYRWAEGSTEPRDPPDGLAVAAADTLLDRRVGELAFEREARRRLDAREFRQPTLLEFPGTLADSLNRDRPEQQYLIGGLWGTAHNLSIEAMFKTGKTTLLASVAGALADGTPFLGFAPAHKPDGTVALWNCEMDPDDFDDYILPHVADLTRIVPAHLRGRPVPLLTSRKDREMTVAWLRFHSAQVWIIDSWTRLCAWNNIDPIDNAAVGRLTAYLDEIKGEAGVTALAVTPHMPHAARGDRMFERGLGAQAFSGWVDCMWRYVRDEWGNRYLSAEGRKVRLEECQVFMGPDGRLTAVAGDRDDVAGQSLEYALLSAIRVRPGRATAQVIKAAGRRKADAEAVLHDLERRGLVITKPGDRGAVLWHPA